MLTKKLCFSGKKRSFVVMFDGEPNECPHLQRAAIYYKVTKGEIDKLQQVIDKLLEQQNIPPSQPAAMQNSFQMQIDSRAETLRDRLN